jgi:hypothetical protein
MKIGRIAGMVAVVGALTLGGTAMAVKPTKPSPKTKPLVLPKPKIPAGWVVVRTAAFTMALPRAWKVVAEKPNPRTPWLGSWRFASARGREKLFVRTEPVQKGTLSQLLAKSIAKLRKRVSGIKPRGSEQGIDGKGRRFRVGYFNGYANAWNHKKRKLEPRPTYVVRSLQQYPAVGVQAWLTYMFTASKFEDSHKFIDQHSSTLEFLDNPVKLAAAKKLAARAPRAAQTLGVHGWAQKLELKIKAKTRPDPKKRPAPPAKKK